MAQAPKFGYFVDHAGDWRWHLKAPNGLIIADSGQGYTTRQDCITSAKLVQAYAPSAEIVPDRAP
ncbi:MAG TPA: YegP family protein [Streptosporangiaceae bacterium]|jgi:uncharacterized protein|nr:YegP family protein [Streptosporangiaceae bacterium]